MKRFLYLLPVLCAICSCSPKLSAVKTDTAVRILTYNIHHANPPSKPGLIDLDAIAEAIRKQFPDLVALQEVDVNTKRSGKVNEAEVLAGKLNMHFYFAKAIGYDGGDYGVAILSKYPLTETATQPLTTLEGTNAEPRVLAMATVLFPGGKKIRFACTHLEVKAEANRLPQVKEIIATAEKTTLPFVLAGDLNTTPGSKTLNLLEEYFTSTCSSCPFSFPADKPTRTIDFILFSKRSNVKVVSHEAIDEQYASDHLPVAAELRIEM